MMDKTRRQEITVYILLWAVTFVSPPLAHYLDVLQTHITFDWGVVMNAWFGFVPFFILFWLHDIFVAPRLLKRGKRKSYAAMLICLLSLFVVTQCAIRPQNKHFDIDEARRVEDIGGYPIHDVVQGSENEQEEEYTPPEKPGPGMDSDHGPANPLGFVHLSIAVLMCGANIAVKLFFKTRRDETMIMEAERHALEKEIEFLTYQINPHFFMNTLNNIHALIDINPEKAKDAVIELSKMLRYSLYEGGANMVELSREVDVIRHYISLMKLRYIDKIDIKTELPDDTGDAKIPPLLLITFIENAFKHGVSYRQASFIHMKVEVSDSRVVFMCDNSIAPRIENPQGGVGLQNVRKRLQLIYKDDHTLDITSDGGVFKVKLDIPLQI